MRNRAMESDMGYDYVLLGYRRKTTLRWSHQGQTVKNHNKYLFLLTYRIPELISRLHQFFRKFGKIHNILQNIVVGKLLQ